MITQVQAVFCPFEKYSIVPRSEETRAGGLDACTYLNVEGSWWSGLISQSDHFVDAMMGAKFLGSPSTSMKRPVAAFLKRYASPCCSSVHYEFQVSEFAAYGHARDAYPLVRTAVPRVAGDW